MQLKQFQETLETIKKLPLVQSYQLDYALPSLDSAQATGVILIDHTEYTYSLRVYRENIQIQPWRVFLQIKLTHGISWYYQAVSQPAVAEDSMLKLEQAIAQLIADVQKQSWQTEIQN